MFSFFRKKKPAPEQPAPEPAAAPQPPASPSPEASAPPSPSQAEAEARAVAKPTPAVPSAPAGSVAPAKPAAAKPEAPAPASAAAPDIAPAAPEVQPPPAAPAVWSTRGFAAPPSPQPVQPPPVTSQAAALAEEAVAAEPAPERRAWFDRLRGGLRKTGSNITQVFVRAKVDEALYEELETALLQADAGIDATEYLLADLKRRVKRAGASDAAVVKSLLADALAELLARLQRPLTVGEHTPTVMMVVGVNGAGKTTTIGKLTRHLVDNRQKVLLAAADTFRAAAREQLAVWAERADAQATQAAGQVEIVSQAGGDPAGVTFDAVVAGKARGCDVVIADTAGRLTTQSHLMEELKKIRRVIGKAQAGAPHEVLLVLDGNTGQNALAQVQAFDAALQLTGMVVTKLDGTAKGGVLAAIALWSRARATPLPVYFIGVGEKLEDLQTFDAREFALALLG